MVDAQNPRVSIAIAPFAQAPRPVEEQCRDRRPANPGSAEAPSAAQEGVNGEAPAAEDAGEAEGAGGLDLKKKKKKKRRDKSELEGLEEPEEGGEGEGEGDSGRTHAGLPWDGTDRDYSYEELLGAPHFPSAYKSSRHEALGWLLRSYAGLGRHRLHVLAPGGSGCVRGKARALPESRVCKALPEWRYL